MRTFWDELLVGAILTSRNIHKQDVLKTAPSCIYKRFYCVATWSNDKVKYPQNLQTVMEKYCIHKCVLSGVNICPNKS